MHEEITALQMTNAWTLVPKPLDANIVRNKWVYMIKRKMDSSIDRYNACLVAKAH